MLSTALKTYLSAPAADTDLQLLLSLARATLPASDTASVPAAVLESFARHALFLRANAPFCRDIPEDIFLHYVFYPRVNSEDLVDCRPFFYAQLAPLVENLSDVEAALAVNRWCAAQVTYESTDERTVNPLTAYSCGLGRCGEESVFAVTAFRSVGIPARQIYVPWWSHCDDNHAWVEVYVQGGWHFLGACEPEPILDRGWFSSAATRAMVACSRSFFDFGLKNEHIINREGQCIHYNQIARYADTTTLTVTVLDARGPVPHANVRFGVVNMADFAPIAQLTTDARGRATLEVGLGSLLVEARKGAGYAMAHIRTDVSQTYTLHLVAGPPAVGETQWDMIAPNAGTKTRTTLTKAQQAAKLAQLAQAQQTRQARISAYFLPEYAAAPAQMQSILRMAGGNAPALWSFYQAHGDKALQLLNTLASKDYRDADPAVLEAFLDMPQGPRIGYEKLSAWLQPILDFLPPVRQAAFRADPAQIWTWVQAQFPARSHRFYDTLWLQPDAALRLGAADEKGRRLLFVAICRSLGIPARLNPLDGKAQFFRDEAYRTAEVQTPVPTIPLEISGTLPYFQQWTLARWDDGWHTLDLSGSGPVYDLPEGRYRLLTANRLPNGNQLLHSEVFDLRQPQSRPLQLRQASAQQMLAHYPVPLDPCDLELRLYLEVGAEPTEHALNELLEAKCLPIPVRLCIQHPAQASNPTLQKVLRQVPGVRLEVADYEDGTVEALARSLYLEPGVWPLLVLTDGTTGYYGHCGYGVNTVPLALGLAKQV